MLQEAKSDRLNETYSYAGTDYGSFGRVGALEIRFKPDGIAIVTEGGLPSESTNASVAEFKMQF